MIVFKSSQADFQLILQAIGAEKDMVGKSLLPEFIPQMCDRVEFRRIGRQRQPAQIDRQGERSALMPPALSSTMTMRSLGCRAATSSRNSCLHAPLTRGKIKVSSRLSRTDTAAYP